MRRILVLTAGFGEGHNSAARNVAKALNLSPGVRAEVHDPLNCFGETYEHSKRRYLDTITRAPGLWSVAYHALDRLPLVPLTMPCLGRVERRLEEILRDTNADSVVCTYPLYPWLLRRIAARGGPRTHISTVVTDSISINSVWAKAPSDLWLAADRYSARRLHALGVSAEKIQTTGFPVSPEFAIPHVGEPRSRPDNGNDAKVLLMAGTAARDTVRTARALAMLPGVKLTVTVGRNAGLGERVFSALDEINRPASILGWTDSMPALLREHHIVLGKAGGATTHETLAARTPFIMTHVLPGQEQGNATLIRRLDVGEVATTPASAVTAVAEMLKNSATLWHERLRRLERRTTASGAIRAAEAVLKNFR